MATTSGSLATATDFNNIRTRIIAEFNTTNRRNIGTNYTAPNAARSAGQTMNATAVDGMAKNLYYVNSSTYTSNGISAGTKIAIAAIDSALSTYEGKAKQGTNSGCKSGCIGLCQGCSGGCQGSCTGCSGGCGDGCWGCSGSCGGSCISGCADSCLNGCFGGCRGSNQLG